MNTPQLKIPIKERLNVGRFVVENLQRFVDRLELRLEYSLAVEQGCRTQTERIHYKDKEAEPEYPPRP